MESYARRETKGGLNAYVQRLESFVLMPRGYLQVLRERGSIIESAMFLAILKAEICEFSDLVEQLGAERVSVTLAPIYTAVAAIVHNSGGEIIEFQPNRLTAVWGIRMTESFALGAVLAALDMRKELKRYRDQSSLVHTLGLRIGLDQGRVAEMIIGSSTHQAYSVIGPAILQATRLRDIASTGDIMVSKPVYDQTKDTIEYEPYYVEPNLLKGETQSYLALRVRS